MQQNAKRMEVPKYMEIADLFARHRSIDIIYYKLRRRNSQHMTKENIRFIVERCLAVWSAGVTAASIDQLQKAEHIIKILCPNYTWRRLCAHFDIKPFAIQLTEQCHEYDALLRQAFCMWASCRLLADQLFYRQIFFSDEAEFWVDGTVRKHNCYFVSGENRLNEAPSLTTQKQRVTVWCGIHAGGIIGPYFFQSKGGERAYPTMRAEYRALITQHLLGQKVLGADEESRMWFQQDDAPCHEGTGPMLKTMLKDKFISSNGPVHWPPRSCDLTPMDYFLWGYLRTLVYAEEKPRTVDELIMKIRQAIATIDVNMLEAVFKHWSCRIHCVLLCCRCHLDGVNTAEKK